MPTDRRSALKTGSVLAMLVAQGVIGWPEARAAAARAGFAVHTLDAALAALGGSPANSDQVQLSALDVVEDGSMAPVRVVSRLPDTTEIHLLVEKNPVPLSASFTFPPGSVPDIQVRLKMSDTSRVFAVVRAGGKLYAASRETRVTVGSCGG